MKRALASALGLVIGVAGIAFVLRTLLRDREAVVAAASGIDPWLGALAIAVGLTGMIQIGLAWRHALRIVGVQRPRLDTLYRYFIGQLGKYVPGGIWPVVGRAEMARRGGISAGAAYSSTVLSLGTTYLAAIVLVVATIPFGLGADTSALWVIALLPLGVLALHPTVVTFGLDLLERATRRRPAIAVPPWGSSITLLVRHVPAWLSIGLATWLVAFALGDGGVLGNVLFATALSWVVGFIIVPVPGGIGVREAVFTATATSLSPGVAAATAILARLVFITVDLGGSATTAMLVQRSRARTSP
jgi:glycosyltransferase 2 family protein